MLDCLVADLQNFDENAFCLVFANISFSFCNCVSIVGMLNWRHSSTFLALVRDQSQARNRVTIDWQGVFSFSFCCLVILNQHLVISCFTETVDT